MENRAVKISAVVASFAFVLSLAMLFGSSASAGCVANPYSTCYLNPSVLALNFSPKITAGTPFAASVTLTGVSASAGGTVMYWISPGSTCAGPYTQVGSPVTVTWSNVPRSQPYTLPAGSYSLLVMYSGDEWNAPATICIPLTVS